MKEIREVKIGSKMVGDDHPCYIVAEIGNNHNGRLDIAKRLIETAIECGADGVKFQKRDIDSLMTNELKNQPYLKYDSFGLTYGEHRQKLELSEDDWHRLFNFAKKLGIDFYATPFDFKSVDFLEELGVPCFKIASFDVTNLPLIDYICKIGKPVILSTGMCTWEELDEAVGVIRRNGNDFILLHCISAYPHDNEISNLRMIQKLKERYKVPVGYSGHEKSGFVVSLGARMMGACMIEKHFTLDRTEKGPDHASSLEPKGLEELVKNIRKLELALGDGEKRILEIEMPIRLKMAKSIVTTRYIKAGEILKREDITVKCPGTGLKPKYIDAIVGKTVKIDLPEDTIIPPDAINW
ncbi:MAG: N-acetylneuraminate synthase family protein [Candidatus Jordarchaeaceae archaeon]